MRPYRGLTKEGKGVEGSRLKLADKVFIIEPGVAWHRKTDGVGISITRAYEVIPETVGQSIGLKDKNGKEIYEGDIVKFYFTPERGIYIGDHKSKKRKDFTEMIDVVIFEEGAFYFLSNDVQRGAFAFRYNSHCEVIGNIHDKEKP